MTLDRNTLREIAANYVGADKPVFEKWLNKQLELAAAQPDGVVVPREPTDGVGFVVDTYTLESLRGLVNDILDKHMSEPILFPLTAWQWRHLFRVMLAAAARQVVRLTKEQIEAWRDNEISTLHPSDDFEGPRRELIGQLCDLALLGLAQEQNNAAVAIDSALLAAAGKDR